MATYHVENFGCRATQADGSAIERQLLAEGLSRATSPANAEVVILNTCTVTASADHDARAAIRRIHRQNPGARILVTGCYAQRAPQEIAAIPGVDLVVGNSHKHEIASYISLPPRRNDVVPLEEIGPPRIANVVIGDVFGHTELIAAPVFEGDEQSAFARSRPNLKVQDGCNNRCSFCIIPSVRGKSRSLHPDVAVREVQSLVGKGYREIVLSGINLGQWGRELRPRLKFPDLLRCLLASTSIERLRISSVEPMDWTDELIELVASSPRIAKHAHVPLQSGSDRILRAMHRRYRPWHYADRIRRVRAAMPAAAIGADVMVGFPGEGDGDFEETRSLIEELPFTYLHVFTYSSRPGTRSESMGDQVPAPVAHKRNENLRELAASKKRHFMQSFIGSKVTAVTLSRQQDGQTEALTDNYLKLWVIGRHNSNELIEARIYSVRGDALIGERIS